MLIKVFYQNFIQKVALKNPMIYEMNEHFPPQSILIRTGKSTLKNILQTLLNNGFSFSVDFMLQ